MKQKSTQKDSCLNEMHGKEDQIHEHDTLAHEEVHEEFYENVFTADPESSLDPEHDPLADARRKVIAEKEDEYHARRHLRTLSPERSDPFESKRRVISDKRSYADILAENKLTREQADVVRQIRSSIRQAEAIPVKQRERTINGPLELISTQTSDHRQWDMNFSAIEKETPKISDWDTELEEEMSVGTKLPTSSTIVNENYNAWVSQTPSDRTQEPSTPLSNTSSAHSRLTRWDATPAMSEGLAMTPVRGPGDLTVRGHFSGMETPIRQPLQPLIGSGYHPITSLTAGGLNISPEIEFACRNAPLSDYDLDLLLPDVGYVIVDAPLAYIPARRPTSYQHSQLETSGLPAAELGLHLFIGDGNASNYPMSDSLAASTLPMLKPDDYQHFGSLLVDANIRPESSLSISEIKELKLLRLLLKLKNGTPPMRKIALRQLAEKACEFGPALLFDKILPLLMSPSLEDQERHLLVKAIDRILFRLEDAVRPYVHKILVVIEPLLIDEDYTTRVEGREIISNLAKAAGLATMIGAMRPDIDHPDEYVRNTTARALAVVSVALGIPALCPFLAAVTASQKGGWEARHTGIRTVQQIAILVGCGVLPHLRILVSCVSGGLSDSHHKVRSSSALALAALAEAASPHGIDAFEGALKPLWSGIKQARGKALAAFLKAIGAIIPLMDAEYASYYTREVISVIIREFSSPDDELKRTVLLVIRQCSQTDGVSGTFLVSKVIPPFFSSFWIRRSALDRRISAMIIESVLAMAHKAGASTILPLVLPSLKDDSEPFRRMGLEMLEKLVMREGVACCLTANIDELRSVALITDSLLFTLQQEEEEPGKVSRVAQVMGCVFCALGNRMQPHLSQLISTLLWRLNNKSSRIRQQSADVVSKVAPVFVICNEDSLLGRLGLVLYEYLGEEYPEVLGSILSALHSIVDVLGVGRMQPPIKDLLPRLTPILKNRHEKVQEHCIELVGLIADKSSEAVSPREWMRICFELLETLHSHRRSIRRAAILAFGHIAKSIGPQDVLSTLLSNLRVQERQSRVCTTIAIAIVAEVSFFNYLIILSFIFVYFPNFPFYFTLAGLCSIHGITCTDG